MKGVSEVIAIILILMIVIALSALAYTWFSGIFASMTQSAGTAVTATTNEMATQFRIESVKWNSANTRVEFSIRNTGTQELNASRYSIAFYSDGVLYNGVQGGTQPVYCTNCLGTCPSDTLCRIPYGSVATYLITFATAPTCGTSVGKVTIGTGLTDSKVIAC